MGWKPSRQQVLGVALISVALATSIIVPGIGLADDFLIPLGLYLIASRGRGRKKWRRRRK